MVQSRTGSGKTGAFVLPILERIDPQNKSCQALIMVPTRELAQQVTNEAQLLAAIAPSAPPRSTAASPMAHKWKPFAPARN